MKVIIYQLSGQSSWYIMLESSNGVLVGKTCYATKQEAEEAARSLHPDLEIMVQE
jgi:hypothetical protein